MTTLEQFLNEHALETAREFGIESRSDGQGTADSATGASGADIVQAVRDYTTGSTVSNADILTAWLDGYNSELAIALVQQWTDGAVPPHAFADDSDTNHTASSGIYCAVCSHESAHPAHMSAPRHRADTAPDTLPTPLPSSHVVGMYPVPSVLPVAPETEHYSFGAGAL